MACSVTFIQQTLKNEQPQREDNPFTFIPVDTVLFLDAHFSVFQTNCKEVGVPHTAIFINKCHYSILAYWVFLNSEALLCQQTVCVGFYLSIFRQLVPSVGADLPVQVTVCVCKALPSPFCTQGRVKTHPGQGSRMPTWLDRTSESLGVWAQVSSWPEQFVYFNSLVCKRRNSCLTTTSTSTSSSVSNLPLHSSMAGSHSAPSFPIPSHPFGIIHGSVCPSSRSPSAGAPVFPVVHLLLRRAAEAVGGESAPRGPERGFSWV